MSDFFRLAPLVVAIVATLFLGLYTLKRPIAISFSVGAFIVAFLFQCFADGFISAIISAGVAVGVFVVLFFVGALNRSTTFMLPAVLALLPLNFWWVFIPGAAILAILSLIFVVKALGTGEIKAMAVETSSTVQFNGPTGLPGLVRGHANGSKKVRTVNVFLCLCVGLAASLAAVLVFF